MWAWATLSASMSSTQSRAPRRSSARSESTPVGMGPGPLTRSFASCQVVGCAVHRAAERRARQRAEHQELAGRGLAEVMGLDDDVVGASGDASTGDGDGARDFESLAQRKARKAAQAAKTGAKIATARAKKQSAIEMM